MSHAGPHPDDVPQSVSRKAFLLEATPSDERQVRAAAAAMEEADADVFNPSSRPGVTIVALVGREEAEDVGERRGWEIFLYAQLSMRIRTQHCHFQWKCTTRNPRKTISYPQIRMGKWELIKEHSRNYLACCGSSHILPRINCFPASFQALSHIMFFILVFAQLEANTLA